MKKILGTLIIAWIVVLFAFWLDKYIDSHYDEYKYHIRIIHCDGRLRDLYVIRRENNPPRFNEIRNTSGTNYIPVWGKHRNVCDIEILDKTLYRKAER